MKPEQTENGITAQTTVAELVIRHPQLRTRLEQLGVDYCCGGKKALADAIAAAGRDWESTKKELLDALADTPHPGTDWNRAPLAKLVDHIVDTHHAFMKEQLPRLGVLLEKVEAAHGDRHGKLLDQLQHEFQSIRTELESHLRKEEEILFPAIKASEHPPENVGEKPVSHCGSIQNPIRQMEAEHDDAGEGLASMRQLTDGYSLPADACPSFAALYDGLQAMEADLHEHIHLENNILFPRSIEQEAEMAGHDSA